MPNTIQSFWTELKRRRVVRLAVVYVIAAWIVVEVSATVFPALQIPDWALSLVVILVILGFPISLTLAWAFDLTPMGVVRAAPVDTAGRADSTVPVPGGPATVERAAPGQAAPTAPGWTGAPGRGGESDPAAPELPERGAPAEGATGGDPADDLAGAGGTGAAAEKSIAVLPFVNMSDDPENEYFSDGMTEELLNALVRVRDLQVASRTSSFALKGKDDLDIQGIARKLRVAHVLEGSVRKAGDRVRITAQLIDARNGYHLWSEAYDRELKDIFQVQDEIARAIVDALKVQFGEGSGDRLVAHTTDDLEAYTLYLKARFHYNKVTEVDLRRSIELYREALRDDPGYARAWAGIADCWMLLADDWMAPNEAYPKAKEAALKALAIDPGLAEANTALGKVLGWYDWDFDAGELALRRAVASNPKYADAHWGLATLLPTNGRLDESVEEMRTALALDPLSASMSRWLARYLLYSGRHEEALEMCRNALALNAQHAHAYLVMGQTHLDAGDADRAIEAFRDGARVGEIGFFQTFLGSALAAAGREADAREILDRLRAEEDGYVRPEAVAMLHGWLGEMDPAFQRLEEAIAARSAGLIYLHCDPSYAPLRADPRFGQVVGRLGLRMEAPQSGMPRPA